MAVTGVELATAYISIIPSAKGIGRRLDSQMSSELSRAGIRAGEQSGRNFSSGLSSGASRGISNVTKLIGGLGIAAAGAAGAAGAVGIKAAANLETSEIAFTTMLGSAERAQKLLGDLAAFAAKTPFDLPGLQNSASSLIAIGIDAERVIPIMTTLGNVTSGMGTGAEGIRRATNALQQMNAAQKISAEDLNQLRDAGIPVYDLLTAATGKTTAQIAEMRDKGKLGKEELDLLMDALESGRGFERFDGLMQKQAESLTGLWSTAKDTFQMGMAEAVQPIIPLLKDGLGGATAFLSDTALPAVQAGLHGTVTGVTNLFDNLSEFSAGVKNGALTPDLVKSLNLDPTTGFGFALNEGIGGLRAFSAAWSDNSDDVTSSGFAGYMEVLANKLRDIWDVASDVGETLWDTLSPALGGLVGPAFDLAMAISPVGILLGALAPVLPLLVESAGELAAVVATGLTVALEFLVPIITGLVGGIADFFDGVTSTQGGVDALTAIIVIGTAAFVTHKTVLLGATIASKAHAAATAISTAKQWLLNAAMRANPMGIVLTAVTALVAGLIWFFTETETGREIIKNVWSAIQTFIGGVVAWFQDHVLPVIQAVFRTVGEVFSWLWTNIIEPVFNFAGAAIGAWWLLTSTIFQIAVAIIRTVLAVAFTWLWENIIQPVWTAISDFIGDSWNTISIIFGAIVGFLEDTLGPIFEWFWREIIEPVWNNITGLIDAVWTDTVKPVFDAISSAIEDDVPNAFETGVGAIEKAWNALQEVAKVPVRFVVNDVLNNGLIAGINGIAKTFGIPELPDIKLPRGFMHGGYTGDGPRNLAKGIVHAGEYVLTKDEVNLAGGPHAVAAMAAALHAAAPAPFPGQPPYFFTGRNEEFQRARRINLNTFGHNEVMRAYDLPGAIASWNGHSGLRIGFGSGAPSIPTHMMSLAGYRSMFGFEPAGVANSGMIALNTFTNGYPWGHPVLRAVAAHEIGHAFGLPHTNSPSIMQPMVGPYLWPTALDYANLQRLYGLPGSGVGAAPMPRDEVSAPAPDPTPNLLERLIGDILGMLKEKMPAASIFADMAIGAGQHIIKGATDWLIDKVSDIADFAKDVWNNVVDLFGGGQIAAPTGTLYDNGGWWTDQFAVNKTGEPEAILNPRQWELAEKALTGEGGHPPVVAQFYGADMDQATKITDELWFSIRRRNRGGVYARRR